MLGNVPMSGIEFLKIEFIFSIAFCTLKMTSAEM